MRGSSGRELGGESGDAALSFAPIPDGRRNRAEPATSYRDGSDDVFRATRLSYGFHLRVLLVEDDATAARSFIAAAEESVLEVHVDVATGADDAMNRLHRSIGPRRRHAPPDIVVASLEVAESHRLLGELRLDARFDMIPVVVLSEELAAGLERRSFALGAAGHLTAPRRDYERVALVHTLPDFIPQARAAHIQVEAPR